MDLILAPCGLSTKIVILFHRFSHPESENDLSHDLTVAVCPPATCMMRLHQGHGRWARLGSGATP